MSSFSCWIWWNDTQASTMFPTKLSTSTRYLSASSPFHPVALFLCYLLLLYSSQSAPWFRVIHQCSTRRASFPPSTTPSDTSICKSFLSSSLDIHPIIRHLLSPVVSKSLEQHFCLQLSNERQRRLILSHWNAFLWNPLFQCFVSLLSDFPCLPFSPFVSLALSLLFFTSVFLFFCLYFRLCPESKSFHWFCMAFCNFVSHTVSPFVGGLLQISWEQRALPSPFSFFCFAVDND